MNGRATASLALLGLTTVASAQATHHGYMWIEGPSEVLAPNTTYTLEVWARFESPAWVGGVSMIAGFGSDILNVGGGSFVSGVSNVRFEEWAVVFGNVGEIDGNDIIRISGGQRPGGWVDPPDSPPPPPEESLTRLYTFDFTTGTGPLGAISFAPANPNPNGGLSFYPAWTNGASMVFPNTPGTALHFDGWTSTVPSPGAIAAFITMTLISRRRR